jgi:hypothetical protein
LHRYHRALSYWIRRLGNWNESESFIQATSSCIVGTNIHAETVVPRLRDHSQLQDVFRNRILRRVLAEKPLQLLIFTLCAPPGPPLARRLSRPNERASLSQPEAIRSACHGVVPQSQDVGGVLYVLFYLLTSIIRPQITSARLLSENCPPS